MITYIDEISKKVADRTRITDKRLVQLYALLVLTKGNKITEKDVHDAWAMNMNYKPKTNDCFGHSHSCIVPFYKLDAKAQKKDQHFVKILVSIANEKIYNKNGVRK